MPNISTGVRFELRIWIIRTNNKLTSKLYIRNGVSSESFFVPFINLFYNLLWLFFCVWTLRIFNLSICLFYHFNCKGCKLKVSPTLHYLKPGFAVFISWWLVSTHPSILRVSQVQNVVWQQYVTRKKLFVQYLRAFGKA